MQLTSIQGNSQRLDGGAMFGNAPKALWTRWIEPDKRNRIPLACRALLCEENGRRILFEAGIGAFFAPKYKDRYGVVEDEHVLLDSLAELGLGHEDIDIVVLSHLHFDHAGGLLSAFQEDSPPELLFPNAHFIIGREAWSRAIAPHPRDRASFIPLLNQQLSDTNRTILVDSETHPLLGPNFIFHQSHGHTPGLLATEIRTSEGPVLFGSDLIPGMPWMHLPITMGYDRFPELLIEEKRKVLEGLLADGGWMFFVHDADTALAKVSTDDRGRFYGAKPLAELRGWPHL
ncbi:MAG: MBL fold metallo-hydrolase [Myxococcota bacterium]|nr:MBL fold metallo-hydrolase [Myxococcota bacterium]